MTIPADTSRPRDPSEQVKASWRPMIGLALAQVLMSFNVAALPVSLGGMVEDFGVPPTTVSTAIVTYGLVVAALVMVGAKLGQRVGWVLIFRIMVAVFAVAELMMVLSPSIGWVIAAQALAGAAAAIIVPALVALIAENYRDAQQATAIGAEREAQQEHHDGDDDEDGEHGPPADESSQCTTDQERGQPGEGPRRSE